MFQRKSSSVDWSGYVILCLSVAALIFAIRLAVRYSLLLDLGVRYAWQKRCALFSAAGLSAGVVIYVFVLACCLEDERKHHIFVCSPDGDDLKEPEAAAGRGGAYSGQDSPDRRTAIARYLAFL